jgi:HEAT repeat protein
MSICPNDELIDLVLSSNTMESHSALVEYARKAGSDNCIREMLRIFESRLSGELSKKAWEVTLTICLTEDEPEMNQESTQLWTAAFLAALRDERSEIKQAAAEAFGSWAGEVSFCDALIQAFVEGLADEQEEIRLACINALQRAGIRAIKYLLEAIEDSKYHKPHQNQYDRCSSIWDILCTIDGIFRSCQIKQRDRENCAVVITEFLKGRSIYDGMDKLDIWKAGETLGEYIGGKEALDRLYDLIHHTDPRVRLSVAHGLSHIENAKAKQAIKYLLNDPDESVRKEASKYT